MKAEETNISYLYGLGKKYVSILNEQGIYTVKDLMLCYPSKYSIYMPMHYKDFINDENVCGIGMISSPVYVKYHPTKLTSLTFNIDVEGHRISIIIFNRNYLVKNLHLKMMVKVYGKYNMYRNTIACSQIFPNLITNHIAVEYKLKNITGNVIRKAIESGINMGCEISEYLPKQIIEKYHFDDINSLIKNIHFPANVEDIKRARSRIKYESIADFFVKLEYYKSLKTKERREPISYDIHLVKNMIAKIPFELTDDQKKVCNEIFTDFKANYPMNRLVQGDVGSGKTIVALIAAYALFTANKQVVIMAPTEILAKQHYEYFRKFLIPFGVNIALFTSSVSKANKAIIMNNVKKGIVNVLIGTHALYYSDINYKNLGLVIIDEQHRFGVNARSELVSNQVVDALYLSATPIPRSLALTIFADLDLSTIHTVRSDKKEITTKIFAINQIDLLFEAVEPEIKEGHQAYFVVSAIESSDLDNRFDIENICSLLKHRFPSIRIGSIHGKMKDEEKNLVLEKFIKQEMDILVSTTVIEVGISIDNATVMAIIDAQNFGLSQLHQLRGRVGRGNLKGYCYLLTNDVDIDRLKTLEKCSDGFTLAEMDLKLRGPGDYFGMRQSGIPSFVFADFNKDYNLFSQISKDVRDLFKIKDNDKIVKKYIDEAIKSFKVEGSLN